MFLSVLFAICLPPFTMTAPTIDSDYDTDQAYLAALNCKFYDDCQFHIPDLNCVFCQDPGYFVENGTPCIQGYSETLCVALLTSPDNESSGSVPNSNITFKLFFPRLVFISIILAVVVLFGVRHRRSLEMKRPSTVDQTVLTSFHHEEGNSPRKGSPWP